MNPFNEQDLLILPYAFLNGMATAHELSEKTKIPDKQIRADLQKLQDAKIITPYTLANHFLLGRLKSGVYFSFGQPPPKDVEKIIKKLCSFNQITSVIELFGKYQYFMSISLKSMRDFETFMQELHEAIPAFRVTETMAFRSSLTLFKRKYLFKGADKEFLRYELGDEPPKIDEKSIAVLNAITTAGGHPEGQEIANATGIPLSSVYKRIKRLEADGIIVGYPYGFDPTKIGYHSYDLLIKTLSRRTAFKKKFFEFCLSHPNIIGLTECVGAWQYELRIEVPTASAANGIGQQIREKFGEDLGRIDTVAIGREFKYMQTPILKQDERL